MLGKLTQETLKGTPALGALSQETLNRVRQLGADPEVTHRGYRIHPTPKQLQTGEWTLEGFIARDHDGKVHEQVYSTRNTFKTRDEAVAWAIQFGQDVIDGKVPGLSVSAL